MPNPTIPSLQVAHLVQSMDGLTKALSEHELPARMIAVERVAQGCLAKQEAMEESVRGLEGTAHEIRKSVDELMALKNKGAGILYAIGVGWTVAAIIFGAIASQFAAIHWKG